MIHKLDEQWMIKALDEAKKGRTSPNPHVGAVIVRDDKMIALGHHEKAGEPHAEVNAIEQAGERVKGSTLYVTFEPCNHFGRTGPCTDAIIKAGIKRVVIGCKDPHPHVAGATEKMRAAGIEVDIGVCKKEAEWLVADFAKHISTGLPYVNLKVALTFDGKMATQSRNSQWITGQKSRHYVHQMRNLSDAVLVGIQTVIHDDPELTVRLVEGQNPIRIILDTHLQTPTFTKLTNTHTAQTIIFHGPNVDGQKQKELESKGVECLEVPIENGHVSFHETLKILGKRNIVRLMVEGGPTLASSLIEHHHVDRMTVFMAPIIVGDSLAPAIQLNRSTQLMSDAFKFHFFYHQMLGEDILIEGSFAAEK